MNISNNGANFIKKEEGLSLKVYVDAKGFAIGYGNNFWENGNKVKKGDSSITKERAESLLRHTLKKFEKIINQTVTVKLNQNQYDALISFVYNVGDGSWRSSTLRQVINKNPNNEKQIRYEFSRWDKGDLGDGKGKVSLKALTKRRKLEADLYFSKAPNNSGSSTTGDDSDAGDSEYSGDESNDVISEDDGGTSNLGNGIEGTDGSEGIVNILKPTIAVDPISINSPDDPALRVRIGKLPFIWFNETQIDLIESFVLSSADFLPILTITFKDGLGYFSNLRFANDDDKLKLFIDSKSELLRPIYAEFKILDYHRLNREVFKIVAVLNVNQMLTAPIESFGNSTSFETLYKIAESSGLGFNTNINNTNDHMNWINPGNRRIEFCKDVVRRSYRGENSFMWGFVDLYYNFNFIDIESQLSINISDQLGVTSNDLGHILDQLNIAGDTSATTVVLSNDRTLNGTSNYFESFKIFNTSTKRSIEEGYASRVKYYDWKTKSFLMFDTETFKSTNSNNLILKSDDETFQKENVRRFWEGKIVDNNAHNNYLYTSRQNISNLNELQKLGIQIILPVPNYNIYRFMKIYIMLINQNMDQINPIFNAKLSGDWLVTESTFFLDDNILKQRIKLVRREAGFSQEEIENGDDKLEVVERGDSDGDYSMSDDYGDYIEPPVNPNYKSKISKEQRQLMVMIYNILIKKGLSKNQAQILVAEIGRENSFISKYMFKSHVDPHRGVNIGMISWQGTRGKKLRNRIKKAGLLKSDDTMVEGVKALEVQVDHILHEMKEMSEYKRTKKLFLQNPDVSYRVGNEVLGNNYIRWRYSDKKYSSGHKNRDMYYNEIRSLT